MHSSKKELLSVATFNFSEYQMFSIVNKCIQRSQKVYKLLLMKIETFSFCAINIEFLI